MVADFGSLTRTKRRTPGVGAVTTDAADTGDADDVCVARVFAALMAIEDGRYDSDGSILDATLDAVLSDIE